MFTSLRSTVRRAVSVGVLAIVMIVLVFVADAVLLRDEKGWVEAEPD